MEDKAVRWSPELFEDHLGGCEEDNDKGLKDKGGYGAVEVNGVPCLE